MKRIIIIWLSLIAFLTSAKGQEIDAQVYYTDDKGVDQATKSIDDGQAPLQAVFRANPSKMGEWIPSFEWHFFKLNGTEGRRELFVRFEEDTEYTFTESGTYNVILRTTLRNGNDTARLDSATIVISISESKLEFPNAFSPNDDEINDKYQAKEGYKSIVYFHAIILNRWGQKLYEWRDPAGGWDGKFNGTPVKEGVYYVRVKARGADGKEYDIRKDVNLIRGHSGTGGTTGGSHE